MNWNKLLRKYITWTSTPQHHTTVPSHSTYTINPQNSNSCHPRHTIENLAGSLARRIIRIVSNNQDLRLKELTEHMVARGHPVDKVQNSISNAFKPHKRIESGEPIVFTRTFSPRLVINLKEIKQIITNFETPELKRVFRDKWVLLSTRQPKNLRSMLTSAKFILNPIPPTPRTVGLIPCGNCTYCRTGYIRAATGFRVVNDEGRVIEWTYNRMFSCKSLNVLYVVTCNVTPHFYVGKTMDTTKRCCKHASDVRHPHNSNCKKCADHLRGCSGLIEPFFSIYPFFYEDDNHRRHLLERRFINKWKPNLNGQ